MQLWSAFLLGFIGSLHCAGMCGPLVLAMRVSHKNTSSWLLGRLIYNAGRGLVYGALGSLCGLIGATLVFAGLQRWLSIIAGIAMLAGLAASSRFAIGT